MNLSKIFWDASVEEMKDGYIFKENHFICLCFGASFDEGIVYPFGDVLMNAKKAVTQHNADEHQPMFSFLLNMDKKYTGVTNKQKLLMTLFYEGISDKDIAKRMGGSPSTVRNQRFSLREKAKSAKIFLSIMELLEEQIHLDDQFISIHRNATNVDERYAITEKEQRDCLDKYFTDDRLISFSKKQKRIIIVLQYITSFFDKQKKYSEKEVNELLKKFTDDFVTLRRYLIKYTFLQRKRDGSEYWINL